MNFLAEWNRMYDFCMSNRLSKSEILLLHALYMVNNKKDWDAWFEADNHQIQRLTGGLSRQSIIEARNKLKQRGRIEFKEGKKNQQAPFYRIITFFSKIDIQPDIQGDKEVDIQPDIQGDLFNKLNQTKPNQEEVLPQKNPPIPYVEIQMEYNRICTALSKCTKLSNKRKEAIAARIHSGYSLEDFVKLFEIAQASDFLKGKNKNNWRADFDWLICDSNMAKTLDGRYENRSAAKQSQAIQSDSTGNAFFDILREEGKL